MRMTERKATREQKVAHSPGLTAMLAGFAVVCPPRKPRPTHDPGFPSPGATDIILPAVAEGKYCIIVKIYFRLTDPKQIV